MPGTANQLMPAGYLGPSGTAPGDPSSSFGQVYQLPKYNPPATYTGAIPTPSADYGPTTMQLPHDYYNAVALLKQNNQYTPQIDQWLQSMYLQRQGRT
jgi:hypothetical protein